MTKRETFLRLTILYVAVGIATSVINNLMALTQGEPTAFAWTGSIWDNLVLFFWWFLIPALIWPLVLLGLY